MQLLIPLRQQIKPFNCLIMQYHREEENSRYQYELKQAVKEYKLIKEQQNQLSQISKETKILIKRFQILPNLEILIFIQFFEQPYSIKTHIEFIKNGVILRVKAKELRILLCRLLNKINADNKLGVFFKLNPFNCSIILQQICIYTKSDYKTVRFSSKNFLDTSIQQLLDGLNKYLFRILTLIDQLDQKIAATILLNIRLQHLKINCRTVEKIWIQRKKKNRQPNKETMDLIYKILVVNKYQYKFMYDANLTKTKSKVFAKERLATSKNFFKNNKQQSKELSKEEITQIYKNFNIVEYPINEQFNYQQDWIEQSSQSFIKYLVYPIAKINNEHDNLFLFKEIEIKDSQSKFEKNLIIQQTQSTILYRIKINFFYVQEKRSTQKYLLNKVMAVKEQKINQFYGNRIKHEKQILSLLTSFSSVYVVKSYHTKKNQQFKHDLIMDFYIHLSIQHFRRNFEHTFSLMAKIYMLCQLVQGIRFLRDKGITHLNLKPNNVLVGRCLIVRVSDFSKAYHPNVNNQEYQEEFKTISPPQVVAQNLDLYNEKTDVYFLGLLMHQIFFNNSLIQIQNSKIYGSEQKIQQHKERTFQKLDQQYIDSKIIINPMKYNSFGPQKLMETLAYLCLKCIIPSQNQRPYLDWILVQLRQSIQYLDAII